MIAQNAVTCLPVHWELMCLVEFQPALLSSYIAPHAYLVLVECAEIVFFTLCILLTYLLLELRAVVFI